MGDPLVLVVDDSRVIRELISVNLEMEGFDVHTASDGVAALEALDHVRPQVITLDAMMPRLDGFATLARLRADERTRQIPVVMVTARAQAADIARGKAAGADAYVTKPFEPADLVDLVRRFATEGRAGG